MYGTDRAAVTCDAFSRCRILQLFNHKIVSLLQDAQRLGWINALSIRTHRVQKYVALVLA